MLQELGLSYDFVKVDLLSGEHKTPEHVARHGHGLVPALEDGDVRMIESTAAVLYLADKHADKGLAPPASSPARARYYQLAIYAVSTLDETVVPLFFHTVLYPPEKRQQSIVDAKTPVWEAAAQLLVRELGGLAVSPRQDVQRGRHRGRLRHRARREDRPSREVSDARGVRRAHHVSRSLQEGLRDLNDVSSSRATGRASATPAARDRIRGRSRRPYEGPPRDRGARC